MSLIEFLKLNYFTFKECLKDRAEGLAASMAYYQLLSIPPYIALIVILSSYFLGEERAKEHIEPLITQFIHPKFIQAIKYMLSYSFKLDTTKLLAVSLLALLSLVHGTFGYFNQVKDSLETFWNQRTENTAFKKLMIKKLQAIFIAAVIFTILLAGFILCYFLYFSGSKFIQILMYGVEIVMVFSIVLFLILYCPPEKIYWKDALPGVILTTILYLIGRMILNYILNTKDEEAEKVAAALIMYLLWSYYSSLTFLFGAEFTKIFIERRRKKLQNAIKIIY